MPRTPGMPRTLVQMRGGHSTVIALPHAKAFNVIISPDDHVSPNPRKGWRALPMDNEDDRVSWVRCSDVVALHELPDLPA